MLTEEFKAQMRLFLANAFELHEEILCNPYSINNDLSYDEKYNIIQIPLFAKKYMIDFFRNEGLSIKEKSLGLYSISPVL